MQQSKEALSRMARALMDIRLWCADELLTDHSSRRSLLKKFRRRALEGLGPNYAESGDREFAHEDASGHHTKRPPHDRSH